MVKDFTKHIVEGLLGEAANKEIARLTDDQIDNMSEAQAEEYIKSLVGATPTPDEKQ